MYERVIKHREQGSKRDRSLIPHIALVAAIALAIIVPFAYMGSIMYRYQCFKQDLAASMAYAEQHGTLSESNGNRFFTLVADAGMGKPQRDIPQWEPARYEFGDGSTLELWKVAIDGNSDNPGTLIRYTRADGSTFTYDTDRIEYEAAVDMLG